MGHYGKHDMAVGECECDECQSKSNNRTEPMSETDTTNELEAEKKQACETLMALLSRADNHHKEHEENPLECRPYVIKVAGMLRDELDMKNTPSAYNVDPDEIFGDKDTDE